MLLIDVLIEIFLWWAIEGVVEMFCSMAYRLFPNRCRSPKAEIVITIISGAVGISMLVLGIVGIFMMIFSDAKSVVGWIFVFLFAAFVISSVICAVINRIKKKKEEKRDE